MLKFRKIPEEAPSTTDMPVIPLMSLKDEFRLTQAPVQVEQWQNILSELEFNKANLQTTLQSIQTQQIAFEKGEEENSMDGNLVSVLQSEMMKVNLRCESEQQISQELENKLWDTKQMLLYFKKFIFDEQQALSRYEQKHLIITEQTNGNSNI